MSTTIEVPDDVLQRVVKASGGAAPRDAVLEALEEYAQRHGQADLIQYLGKLEGFPTQEELRLMRESERIWCTAALGRSVSECEGGHDLD